jgi:dolichyl-phosphate beta-glucosyltransferase
MASASSGAREARFSLRLVIPAYNPGPELEVFLPELADALAATGWTHQILVVDDGSTPAEAARIIGVVEKVKGTHPAVLPPVRLERNRGKGFAVRAGWDAALSARAEGGSTAEWLAFVDADGSVSAREVVRLAQLVASGAADWSVDCVIASRLRILGRSIERQWHRHAIGRVYAALVTGLLGLKAYDTQCGYKLVRRVVYDQLREKLSEQRFSFDVELLCALRAAGAKIREEPIDWADRGRSTVRLWRDVPSMAAGVWRVRRRMKNEEC